MLPCSLVLRRCLSGAAEISSKHRRIVINGSNRLLKKPEMCCTVALADAGLISYLSSKAGSLLMDTLSLSRCAVGSAAARLGSLMPSSKASLVSSESATACGPGNVAPDQSGSLVEGDGLVAPGDAHLIFGGTPLDELSADATNSTSSAKRASSGEEALGHGNGVSSAGAADVHIEVDSADSPRTTQAQMKQPAFSANSAASSDATDSGGQLSSELVASVISDKQLGLPDSVKTSTCKQHLHAAVAGKPAQDMHNMLTGVSGQVTRLGVAAIAVNQAEASMAAIPGTEEEQLSLACRLDVPAEVIDEAIGAVPREAGKEAASAPEGRLSQ